MKITVFTSNNPRHIALAEALSNIADEIHLIQECVTIFPGVVEDFYKRSSVMQEYFRHVIAAERDVFGVPRFLPPNVRQLALRTGDLSLAPLEMLEEALHADIFVVFGASYIRPPLIDVLMGKRTVNIHMGISPYYRGTSCNFWALYDGRPDLVGATIHMLSRGIDSGPILYHAKPKAAAVDPFLLGMQAVAAAQESLVQRIGNGTIFNLEPVTQDRTLEIRYTRNADFNDEVAAEYLARGITAAEVKRGLAKVDPGSYLRLYEP
jgi:folate-dependent phosphoribosylglycinamide formyltransferase PurN